MSRNAKSLECTISMHEHSNVTFAPLSQPFESRIEVPNCSLELGAYILKLSLCDGTFHQ